MTKFQISREMSASLRCICRACAAGMFPGTPISLVVCQNPLPTSSRERSGLMMETVGPKVGSTLGLLLLLAAAVASTESPPRQLNTVGRAGAP